MAFEVQVTFREVLLPGELTLDQLDERGAFLHSEQPLPVGTSLLLQPYSGPTVRVRVVEVVEPRRKLRSDGDRAPGMQLAFESNVTELLEYAARPPAPRRIVTTGPLPKVVAPAVVARITPAQRPIDPVPTTPAEPPPAAAAAVPQQVIVAAGRSYEEIDVVVTPEEELNRMLPDALVAQPTQLEQPIDPATSLTEVREIEAEARPLAELPTAVARVDVERQITDQLPKVDFGTPPVVTLHDMPAERQGRKTMLGLGSELEEVPEGEGDEGEGAEGDDNGEPAKPGDAPKKKKRRRRRR